MSRKTAREVAMKHAFALLFGGEDTYEDILEKSGISEKPTADDMRYSDEVLKGIEAHTAEIDAHIARLAIGWSIERMPKVDLTILRIAIYEMLYRKDIPDSVSINEAVELAKRFGGDRSPAYINGMLGTLEKENSKQKPNGKQKQKCEPEQNKCDEAQSVCEEPYNDKEEGN